MNTFSVRDLQEHTGALIHDAEVGKLSLITKRGRPVFLTVPFTEQLLELGLRPALAVSLFREGTFTLEKAAKLSGQTIEAFTETLGELGLPAVDYSANELNEELNNFR